MKVISGTLKGRNIVGYNIEGTRPTMDRIKESIFAMIQDRINDSIVLDLFSGSGNYGIEAISLNAKKVYFNDINKECIKVIKRNLDTFNIVNKSIVYNLDYLKCLDILNKSNTKFDLIFLDPPYNLDCLDIILNKVIEYNLLNEDGLIICEYEFNNFKDEYMSLELIKEKKYGYKNIKIYRKI